ncbi:hypothetical protein PVAR5_3018 [Paecilomyces variotii No. 5]|uniref:Uncharacterized protein n=1 Tax=Byssochlamys spectabilis (strain No. 5 / NBRC 109023) TaxID=1356009 RepID=V5FQZ1_BYSSN|nr:hypothetical protein PVAR5_3018 [Paecilomyces variotii No. 5]
MASSWASGQVLPRFTSSPLQLSALSLIAPDPYRQTLTGFTPHPTPSLAPINYDSIIGRAGDDAESEKTWGWPVILQLCAPVPAAPESVASSRPILSPWLSTEDVLDGHFSHINLVLCGRKTGKLGLEAHYHLP